MLLSSFDRFCCCCCCGYAVVVVEVVLVVVVVAVTVVAIVDHHSCCFTLSFGQFQLTFRSGTGLDKANGRARPEVIIQHSLEKQVELISPGVMGKPVIHGGMSDSSLMACHR